jgi:hypothetical protein
LLFKINKKELETKILNVIIETLKKDKNNQVELEGEKPSNAYEPFESEKSDLLLFSLKINVCYSNLFIEL